MRGRSPTARTDDGATAAEPVEPADSSIVPAQPAVPARPVIPPVKAARARQRILALFLPVTAVLYVSAEALDPKGTDRIVTTVAAGLRLLPIAARHPAQLASRARCPCSPWARWLSRMRPSPCWSTAAAG